MQNFMKTIVNAVKCWVEGKIDNSKAELNSRINNSKSELNNRIDNSKADWNESNESADSYIKNRPFYDNTKITEVIAEETVVNIAEGDRAFGISISKQPNQIGQRYTVVLDGDYYLSTELQEGEGYYYCYITVDDVNINVSFNNASVSFWMNGGTLPFSGEHTVAIKIADINLKTIDEKFIPPKTINAINNAQATAETAKATAETAKATAETAKATVDGKMNRTNPVGAGTFSFGSGTTVAGTSAIAIGMDLKANRSNMTVLGRKNKADNHKYGLSYDGSDYLSVTIYSGNSMYVSTNYSFNTSTGALSLTNPVLLNVSEYTVPDGSELYACGDSDDPANLTSIIEIKNAQWNVNRYNDLYISGRKMNVSDKTSSTKGKYALVVGNGETWSTTTGIGGSYSNAHTIDWDGVGWYQGGLQVGGNAQDDGAKNVLLEGDAIDYKFLNITLPTHYVWSSMAYGDGKFVAVASKYAGGASTRTSTNKAAYSEDGITWNLTTLPRDLFWRSITYGNGKFVAVGDFGIAAYSEDGITWSQTSYVASGSVTPNSITYVNGKFVIAHNGGIGYSEDGVTWHKSSLNTNIADVSYGNGKFIAIRCKQMINDDSYIYYSEDCINWTIADSFDADINTITYGNEKFIVGGSSSLYSEDGITWTQINIPISATDIIYIDGKFIAVGNNASAYSEDGVNWTQTTLPINARYVVYGNGKFIAGGSDNNIISHSKDGIVWNCILEEEICKNNEDVTDNIRDLLLDGYAIPVPEAAKVGQLLAVKAVDENGKPSEWEAVDMPDFGGNVSYDEAQELTDEQKAQARANIGAQPAGNYLTEVPEGYAKTEDIPTDEHINSLINTALSAIPNAAEVAY